MIVIVNALGGQMKMTQLRRYYTIFNLRLQASKGSNVCQLPKNFFVAHFEVPIWVGKLAKKFFDFDEPCGRGTRLKLRYPYNG